MFVMLLRHEIRQVNPLSPPPQLNSSISSCLPAWRSGQAEEKKSTSLSHFVPPGEVAEVRDLLVPRHHHAVQRGLARLPRHPQGRGAGNHPQGHAGAAVT